MPEPTCNPDFYKSNPGQTPGSDLIIDSLLFSFAAFLIYLHLFDYLSDEDAVGFNNQV